MRGREPGRRDRRAGDAGQATLLIIAFAAVLAMGIAMVVDVSAAYLRRQSLDTVADGAALRGADLAATGREVYTVGVPGGRRLELTAALARRAVQDYLTSTGAYAAFPGLSVTVAVDRAGTAVTVRLRAPVDLPLSVPGAPGSAAVGAVGSAVVLTER